MKTTMKKQRRRPVATSLSQATASNDDIAADQKKSAEPSDSEEPFLTAEQLKFHRLLTAENGFSMEAALERLLQEKPAKSTN